MALQTAPGRLSTQRLNAASTAVFVRDMAPFFQGAPAFLARLAAARPFTDDADLFARAAAIALVMTAAEQRELLDAHPRIGADAGTMSAASVAEQGRVAAPPAVQAELRRLNAAYETRFGFRFVVYVAGRSPSEIVPIMKARLGGQPDAEVQTALADVVAIAFDRWGKAG